MTEEYKKRLIELATRLEITLDSQGNIVDPEGYASKIREQASHLVGYIMALKGSNN